MKQFFKFMFASMLGFFLTWVIIFIFFIIIIFSAISSSTKKEVKITENSVLQITLDSPIEERESKNPFENFDFASMKSNQANGLDQIIRCISQAAKDDYIKGIYLNVNDIAAAPATIEEIRNALIDFKKSGKFIVSYSNNYSQSAYYLSSVADKIYMNNEGSIDLRGLSIQIMFFKGAFEKLDIEPQIIRHGKFKSAVEPFILDKMSEANREQLSTYIGSIWNHLTQKIADIRKISVQTINDAADNLLLDDPEIAIKLKFIDGLMYKDEVYSELRKRLKISEENDIKFVSLSKYSKSSNSQIQYIRSQDKIAIIYAVGEINDGDGDDKSIGGETTSSELRKARLDKNVKAVVLRVNSPGGSALASEIIWREVYLTNKVKPVVISMGDYAASGGYYIACAASAIVAEPTTLTGSIGVFGFIPSIKKLLNNKLGITIDQVNTNAHSDYMNIMRPLDNFEFNVIQKSIERVYATFIKHVADGRKISIEKVDSIGQGRIWSGIDAKRLGLVDEIGGIDEAIAIAAKKAKIDKYRIIYLPQQKEFFDKIMENVQTSQSSILEKELGESYMFIQYLRSLKNMKGVQARLPFVLEMK